VTPYKTELQ